MDLAASQLGEIMERAAGNGVAVSLRVDVLRVQELRNPWTVVIASPLVGESGAVRGDFRSLGDCIGFLIQRLRALPGEWEWLDVYSLPG